MHELAVTEDGTHTIYHQELKEHYHSIHGALQESRHVFITHGLHPMINQAASLSILEVGFGSGLNAYLSLIESERSACKLAYDTLEAFPISLENAALLNYPNLLEVHADAEQFLALHCCAWEKPISINSHFEFTKYLTKLEDFVAVKNYDLIFFDAFSPAVQPELWTEQQFKKLFDVLNSNGRLVTYCAKGEVKRNLKKVGFTIQSFPGPPGKREMTVAFKN